MSDQPIRIQLRRVKGWKMPINTVNVARPSKWGNPFSCQWYMRFHFDTLRAVALYRQVASGCWNPASVADLPNHIQLHVYNDHREWLRRIKLHPAEVIPTELRGKNLACWCAIWICRNGHEFGHEVPYSNIPKYCPHCSAPLERAPCHADALLELANTSPHADGIEGEG